MAIPIRVEATGEVFDIQPNDTAALWYVLHRAGIISYPPKKQDKPRTMGDAAWKVSVDVKGIPAIVAKCEHCGASQVFLEGDRMPDKWGNIPPSTLLRAKLEHCKRTNVVPADVVAQYQEAKEGVNR
jgi:hypothetical protein